MRLSACGRRGTLSAGISAVVRKKVVVAMVLASEADIVFLDEPTTGLDVESPSMQCGGAIRRAVENGRTVLMTTHAMEEAQC